MIDQQASNIRILLRSGELLDIGGPAEPHSGANLLLDPSSMNAVAATPSLARANASRIDTPITDGAIPRHPIVRSAIASSTTRLVAAFAAIYLIWGSTYLAIRYAVETIPPLLMMGMRHITAGALLYAWARWRGTPAPRWPEWIYPAVIGTLLFLGGHGSLAWAEQRVPSGIAAVLVATLPIWIVVLAHIWGTERKLSGRSLAGLVLGFLGVAVLFGPDIWRHNGELNLVGAAAVLLGTFVWAAGTIYMRNVKMPDSPLLSSAMQMLAGGGSLLIAATLAGEVRNFHPASVTKLSWLAVGYLIVFGSIIAFTAYTWLHTVAPPSRVSTYAYVNPVAAVLAGWLLAAEPLGLVTMLAMAVILAGVALVNAGNKEDAQHRVVEREDEVAA
jgi:drug/metabolite transporter (DMT)-like permease